MRNELTFSTFDPLFSDAPSLCDLCETKPSVFQFDNGCAEGDAGCRPVKGFCCSSCATQLLDQLQQAESLAWAEEEASVRKEGGDVADFHTRRLATFGTCDRS
jgi:hypothetical protein